MLKEITTMKTCIFASVRIGTITVTVFLFMLTLSAWAETFRDDFDGDLNPLWEPVLGDWKIRNNAYNGQGVGRLPGFSLLPFEVADGLEIEMTVMDTAKGVFKNAEIVLSYVNESEIYLAGFAVQRGIWNIMRTNHRGWDDQVWWRDLALAAAPVVSNRWYVMRLEIDHKTVRLIADDKLKVEYTFHPELPQGRIGLSVIGANSLFDEFRVSGVGAFAIHPKGHLTTTWGALKRRKSN